MKTAEVADTLIRIAREFRERSERDDARLSAKDAKRYSDEIGLLGRLAELQERELLAHRLGEMNRANRDAMNAMAEEHRNRPCVEDENVIRPNFRKGR